MRRTGKLLLLVLMVSTALVSASCRQKGMVDTSGVTGPGGPLPGTARIYGEGKGDLSFRAPADGIFYLYDLDSGRVVITQYLEMNQGIAINPGRGTYTLQGFPAQERALSPAHTHRMYFDRLDGK